MADELPANDAGEQGLVQGAWDYIQKNPYRSAAAATVPVIAAPIWAAGKAWDWAGDKLQGRGKEGREKGVNDVNAGLEKTGRPNLPAWVLPEGGEQEVTVGYTRGGMQPNAAQQGQTVERNELPAGYWEHSDAEYREGVKGAHGAAQAKTKEQGALYDIARDLEDDRRDYATQEQQAASRFSSDLTNARIRMDQAKEKLAGFGTAPKATVAAAFAKANGAQKVAGLVGMIMGGVSAAGFSALSHRPEKNQFFETFEHEAGKVVDAFMADRDTAGKVLGAEQEGMNAIRQAFGDERAAREFVMAGVLQTYKAKLEQTAAQYGIDKTRADYQDLLAQIDGKAAERFKAAATRIQDTAQESQKYVAPQAIKAKVPIADAMMQEIDPKFAREYQAWRDKAARYGAPEYLPPALAAEGKALELRRAKLGAAVEQAGVQRLLGRQDEDTEKSIKDYGDARALRGLDDLEGASMAADRISRKLARMEQNGEVGWLQQYANAVASGGSTGLASSFLAQHAATDPELYNDIAYLSNEYIKAKSGGAVPSQEMTRMFSALGAGDAAGMANFSNGLKRDLSVREGQLGAQFPRRAVHIWHGRRLYDQETYTPPPYEGMRSPE